jgi:hypothetical protein
MCVHTRVSLACTVQVLSHCGWNGHDDYFQRNVTPIYSFFGCLIAAGGRCTSRCKCRCMRARVCVRALLSPPADFVKTIVFINPLFSSFFLGGRGLPAAARCRCRSVCACVCARSLVCARAGCPFWGSIVIINPLIIRPFFDSFVLPVVGLRQMHQHSR